MRVELYIHGLFWKEVCVTDNEINSRYFLDTYIKQDIPLRDTSMGYSHDMQIDFYRVCFDLEHYVHPRVLPFDLRRGDYSEYNNQEEFCKGYCNNVHFYINKQGELSYRELDIDRRERELEKRKIEIAEIEKGVFQEIKDNYNKEKNKGVYAFLDLGD
jgi:hypothetical protein